MNKEQFKDQGKKVNFMYNKQAYRAYMIGGNVYALYVINGSGSKSATIIIEETGFKVTTFVGDITVQSELILYTDIVILNQ